MVNQCEHNSKKQKNKNTNEIAPFVQKTVNPTTFHLARVLVFSQE
jgi:hypothetical protein